MSVNKTFNRLAQRATELVKGGVKTSYPPRTSELMEIVDQMKSWISKIIGATEEYVDINFSTKVVDFFQKNKEKNTTTDKVGNAFEDVASKCERFAPNMSRMLQDAAEMHKRLAASRKDFDNEVNATVIDDLKAFINNQLNPTLRAKQKLEDSRLDLDSNKNKLNKAKNADERNKFETEVRRDEENFKRAHDEAVSMMERTVQEFNGLGGQINDLINAERNYFEACARECQMMRN